MDWVKAVMPCSRKGHNMEDTTTGYKFFRVSTVSEFPLGERLFLEINGLPIVLFSMGDTFLATGDVCTHDGAEIGEGDLDGEEIICPRHGARFNIRTGEAVSFPAVTGIPIYPVRLREGYIEIGIPL